MQILHHYKRFLARTMKETGLDLDTICNFVRRWENRCYKTQRELLKHIQQQNDIKTTD